MPSASSKSSQMNQSPVVADVLQEPIKNAISVADKKLRNLEKRKLKILETKKKADQGKDLNDDQKKALASLESLDHSLETVKDVQKNLMVLDTEYSKLFKKEQKRAKQEQKDHNETNSLEVINNVVEIQGILGELSEEVRPDFLAGENGACQLTEKDLENLDTIYEMINPATSDDKDKKLSVRVKCCSEHIISIVEGRGKTAFEGVTYKDIQDTLKKIKDCGYFDQDITNGGSSDDVVVTKETPGVEEQRPVEQTSPEVSPEEEYPSNDFQEPAEPNNPTIPVNGVDLPPEVQGQETPENEKIDFMGESEINTGSGDQPSLNPVSPEFVPRNLQGGQDDNGRDGETWQQVDGQNHQGNYRGGRGGRRGSGGYRGGRGGNRDGGNYRGGSGPREGGYRGGNRGGGRGGNRGGNRDGGYRGDYRGGPREGGRGRGGRGGGRGGRGGGASSGSGGFGQPSQ